MRQRTVLATALLALAALVSAMRVPAALAGGWATTTIDSLPKDVRAGKAITLGFMVRQHGQTPINDFYGEQLRPYLIATHAESKQQLRADAVQAGEVGHFVVEVTFPESGEWSFKLIPAPFPDPNDIGFGGPGAVIPLTVLPPLKGEPAGDENSAAAAAAASGSPAGGSPASVAAAPAVTAPPSGARAGIWWATGGILIVAAALSVLVMRGGLRKAKGS